ncbi:hypothetical protein Y032_0059g3002 [Ancylostoma ceylanicum]|nr:hypothetical protein Y032_0059g3002 [Ancylostoma ceylanicum]
MKTTYLLLPCHPSTRPLRLDRKKTEADKLSEISGRGLPLKEAEGQRSGVESYVDVHGKRPELLEKSLQGQQRSSDG